MASRLRVIVELKGVTFSYEGRPPVLKDVNLEIPVDSFHFVVGRSGAGKSTLLGLMSGRIKPDSGSLSVLNANLNELRPDRRAGVRRDIGLVYQDTYLIPHLTIYENVALPLMIAGQEDASYRTNVRELLGWVGLAQYFDTLPSKLSQGERQRAGLARAVIGRPDILLADEPTGSLDADLALKMIVLLQELNRMGTTVVVATHDISLLRAFQYPVLMVSGGSVKKVQTHDIVGATTR